MSNARTSKQPERRRAFCAAAWEDAQKNEPLARLGAERFQRFAALWYDVNEIAILRANYDAADGVVRAISSEMCDAGSNLANFLEVLRSLRSTAVRLKWNEEQLEELDAVIDVLLPQLRELPEAWRVPVGFSYRAGRVVEEALEPQHPVEEAAAEPQREKRDYGRTKIALPVRILPAEPSPAPPELTRTVNISRTGIYIHSTRYYVPGMRLFVCCPYSSEPDALNRDYLSQVVRIDLFAGKAEKGIAIKFLQTV